MTKTNSRFNQQIVMITIFLLLLMSLWGAKKAFAETLKTQNFIINITRNCPEGEVICKNVSYTGTNLKTQKSLLLNGKTVYRICSDGITPCQFLGYEFLNGAYRYFVTESGTLKVYKQEKLLLEEQGLWRN